MRLNFNVVCEASGKFEVDPPAWVTADSRNTVKIGGQYAMDIYGLLVDAIAAHNKTIDDGAKE